jgi:nucleotidyltransferase/DNA polymerase involved in DNA repair
VKKDTNLSHQEDKAFLGNSEKGPALRIIVHVDMESFYASVDICEHLDLAGKSVVIGARLKQGLWRGVVSICSYEAEKYGIRSAMPVAQAFHFCPDAIFLPPNFPLNTQVSGAVMAVLGSYGFPFQQVSIDEAFLDISSLEDPAPRPTPFNFYEVRQPAVQIVRNSLKKKLEDLYRSLSDWPAQERHVLFRLRKDPFRIFHYYSARLMNYILIDMYFILVSSLLLLQELREHDELFAAGH